MGKYRIADFNLEFTFHHLDFFNMRLKAYEDNFSNYDFKITSKVNNTIKDEEGIIQIQNQFYKHLENETGIHLITYKNKEGFIAQKITYSKDYRNCSIELIDHPNKILTFEEREYMATCQAFITMASHYNCVMIHASAISYNGQGILFSADSGTGKSTHTQLWQQEYGDKVIFINDDKPMVKKESGVFYVYGSPWSGKTDLNNNLKVPLKALVMLNRGLENKIEKVALNDVIKEVFANISLIKDDLKVTKEVMDCYGAIFEAIPLYRLYCNISDEAPRLVEKVVFGE